MATALAAQLQQLNATGKDNRKFPRQKTRLSILFDAREAADVDVATILTLACSGLEELSKENSSFSIFKKTLFSVQSCQTDRELQDHDFNANLNKSIHNFLQMVSDFALLSTAHQTLEYLIRRYKVHIYNADDLIKCTLPYHETSFFVRILQLSDIEKTRWHFLEGVRKSGAAPPRELLVQQCLQDAAVLDAILETASMLKIGDKAVRARTAYSFSVAIIVGILDAAPRLDSILVNKILTFVLQSFDKGSSEERKIGGLMIIGTLVTKVKLSDEAVILLFDLIVKAIKDAKEGTLFEMVVMIAIQIVQIQSVREIPAKVLRAIGVTKELSTVLSKVCASYNADYALTRLSDGFVKHCLSNHHYKAVLEELLKASPSGAIAQSTALSLLCLITGCLRSEDATMTSDKANSLIMMLVSMKEDFPADVDLAINKFLQSDVRKRDDVAILNKTFKGTLTFILPESDQTVRESRQHSQLQLHHHHEGMLSATKETLRGASSGCKELMEVLKVDNAARSDLDTIETLCIALLALEERAFQAFDEKSQDIIFKRLIELSLSNPKNLQVASRSALQNIKVNLGVMQRFLQETLHELTYFLKEKILLNKGLVETAKRMTAFLEWLLPQCIHQSMHGLISPLFESLRISITLSANGDTIEIKEENSSSHQGERIHASYIQQMLLEVLESILNVKAGTSKDAIKGMIDMDILMDFIRETRNGSTLNQAFSLLATLGREYPDLMLQHVISLFSVIGETTMIQDDSHSFVVIERLLAAVIPTWLENTKDPRMLLEILVRALPDIPGHRRISLLKTTMRLMQESTSLHVLLLLLLETSLLPSKKGETLQKRMKITVNEEMGLEKKNDWFENYGTTICDEYDLTVRLPSLLALLREWSQEIYKDNWKLGEKIIMFIFKQLQRADLSIEVQRKSNDGVAEVVFSDMLEVTLSLIQKLTVESQNAKGSIQKAKNRTKKSADLLLESITNLQSPASFANAIIGLLKSSDENLRIKALNLVSAKMSVNDSNTEKTPQVHQNISFDTLSSFEILVDTIGIQLENARPHSKDAGAILSALNSCSKRLAKEIPSAFVATLQRLLSYLHKEFLPACLECMSSIIVEIGLSTLPMLNDILKGVTTTAKQWHNVHTMSEGSSYLKETDLDLGVLSILEAVLEQLGSFLNPHLDDILQLLLLEPRFYSSASKRISERTQSLRNLLIKAIPVRLLLGPLISVYNQSMEKGESSALACLEMLTLVVSSFEKPSVQAYHKTVFDLCLHSFDLRRQPPDSFTCITRVETATISLFSALVLKLSESTFKPLFVRVLEWAESGAQDESNGNSAVRFIVFYKVVNLLADRLRSVFVPYFRYFLKTCTQQLADDQGRDILKPKKKLKLSNQSLKEKPSTLCVTSQKWHLRYLIICSLQKCFLYDTIGFLDIEKFEMLLQPLVGQLCLNRPLTDPDCLEWIPNTEDMESALIACLGQMAIRADTDLLWKRLNHEVLLCTRSDNVRTKIVSLNIIRFMVDNLKEDYLALLPESIPFLAELLEDHEQSVVAESQQIIKLLEDLSGESLSQYL